MPNKEKVQEAMLQLGAVLTEREGWKRCSRRNRGGTGIVMPQFAESVVSATIGKWLKQPGDRVEEYEPLCEVITDKVTAELPSTAAGVLLEIVVAEGETVEVGSVICYIGEEAGPDAPSSRRRHRQAP